MNDPFSAMLRWAERLMAMDDASWRRHASPASVWTRIATPLPLLALAVWSRDWLSWGALGPVALVLLWIWLNPRLFTAPATFDSWAARAVLGERVLLRMPMRVAPHHRRPLQALTLLSLLGLLPYVWGLWRFDVGHVVLGLTLVVLGKTWFCDRCAWIWEDAVRDGIDPSDLAR